LHTKTFYKGVASLGVIEKGALGNKEGKKEFNDLVASLDLTKIWKQLQ